MVSGEASRQRRLDYRGERRAVLVRVPLSIDEQLRAQARVQDLSLSDLVADLIMEALNHRGALTRTA